MEDRGDGALVLISPEVPKSWLVTRLPIQLAAALGRHNASCSAKARIRLRMALHAGEIHPDAHGITGSAVNKTFRLVEAPALKSALDASAGVLALIVSDWFHDEVVRHEPAAEPGCYQHVRAVMKETRAAAWIRILDPPAGKDSGQADSVTGEYSNRHADSSGGAAGLTTSAGLGERSGLAPRQLPPSPPGFIGRDDELAQLDSWLPPPGQRRSHPVVIAAIHGMAGVGKTALAVHWGHRIARKFPDGQVYMDLRGHSARVSMTPGEALAARCARWAWPIGRSRLEVEEQAALYRSLLAGRRVLVVLDNAAAPEQVRPLLPGSAGCMAVVTSRLPPVGAGRPGRRPAHQPRRAACGPGGRGADAVRRSCSHRRGARRRRRAGPAVRAAAARAADRRRTGCQPSPFRAGRPGTRADGRAQPAGSAVCR